MFLFIQKHKFISSFILLLASLLLIILYRMKGPYRSYYVDIALPHGTSNPTASVLEVGVAKRKITPDLRKYDSWHDYDEDGKYNPQKGDSYVDVNNNGKFDAVWLAGFANNRPAKGVHDDLWVRSIAFRNNGVTIVLTTIDSIGIFHEKFIRIRKMLDPELKIDHAIFSSTHTHQAPDTMGIWSYSPIRPLFDYNYMEQVIVACKESIEEAVHNLKPAEMICAQVEIDPTTLVNDTRPPKCFDKLICGMWFKDSITKETIATVVSWGNHPEALGSNNNLISSDFVHFLRQGLEDGVSDPNGIKGFGGMCLYFQGSLGGLMTPLHLELLHRDGVTKLKSEGPQKARALGENVAVIIGNALRSEKAWVNNNPSVSIVAKTIYVPMAGLYKYAILLGLLHPGYFWGSKARTEINALRIGEIEILTCPGELYPEIAEGYVEAPSGNDFNLSAPIETPGLRKIMKGKMNIVINLANDEIGYIIPKSQWDQKPPFTYQQNKSPYGEENSGGPDVAPTIHAESAKLLERLHSLN